MSLNFKKLQDDLGLPENFFTRSKKLICPVCRTLQSSKTLAEHIAEYHLPHRCLQIAFCNTENCPKKKQIFSVNYLTDHFMENKREHDFVFAKKFCRHRGNCQKFLDYLMDLAYYIGFVDEKGKSINPALQERLEAFNQTIIPESVLFENKPKKAPLACFVSEDRDERERNGGMIASYDDGGHYVGRSPAYDRSPGNRSPSGVRTPIGCRSPVGGRSPVGCRSPVGGRSPIANRSGWGSPDGGRSPVGWGTPTGGRSPNGDNSPTGGRSPTGCRSPGGYGYDEPGRVRDKSFLSTSNSHDDKTLDSRKHSSDSLGRDDSSLTRKRSNFRIKEEPTDAVVNEPVNSNPFKKPNLQTMPPSFPGAPTTMSNPSATYGRSFNDTTQSSFSNSYTAHEFGAQAPNGRFNHSSLSTPNPPESQLSTQRRSRFSDTSNFGSGYGDNQSSGSSSQSSQYARYAPGQASLSSYSTNGQSRDGDRNADKYGGVRGSRNGDSYAGRGHGNGDSYRGRDRDSYGGRGDGGDRYNRRDNDRGTGGYGSGGSYGSRGGGGGGRIASNSSYVRDDRSRAPSSRPPPPNINLND